MYLICPETKVHTSLGMFSLKIENIGRSEPVYTLTVSYKDMCTLIAYIFYFSKGGAYCLYLDSLDREIKKQELKQALEQSGYQVVDEDGTLKAYPSKEQKSQEEISRDIDVFYKQIESHGGTAFGINMNAILNLAKQSASSSSSPDPNLWQWIAILHVGSTIAHEATHAKGHQDESVPQQVESSFEQWALPKINQEYQNYWNSNPELSEYEFSPIELTGQKVHALRKGWHKEAQSFFQQMQFQNLNNAPKGSDIRNKFPKTQGGRADWGMISQMHQDWAIESKLGRGFMSPLPEGVSQEHDSMEEQLRKYRQEMTPYHNLNATTEELLYDQHDDGSSYKSLETLLEEERPSPLMLPLEKVKKSASLNKTATLFGWMNNLEISD